MYSCGQLPVDQQRQDDQLEPRYGSSVLIWDLTLKTCRKQWMIGRGSERGPGISLLLARHDDDDMIAVHLSPIKVFNIFYFLKLSLDFHENRYCTIVLFSFSSRIIFNGCMLVY